MVILNKDLVGEVSKKSYSSRTYFIDATGIAVPYLIYTITFSIKVIVQLGFDAIIESIIIVCIPWENSEVVVCLVLNQRIIPAVTVQG